MEREPKVSRSTDLIRFGRRLWGYLLSMRQITDALYQKGIEGPLDEAEIDILLQRTLPALRQGFKSKVAFAADEKGRISIADPQDSDLVGKDLPDTSHGQALMKEGKPLVVAGGVDEYPELRALGVRSLLVVRLETPWGRRFVGVCDGGNDPEPYLSEDKQLLNELMKVMVIGSRYGESGKERRVASDRYAWARLRGEWEYLSRASEDYARARLGLQRSDKEARPCHGLFDGAGPDDLLADYLDAELCRVLRMHPTTTTDEQEQVPNTLLKLCRVAEDQEGQYVQFSVKLRDNGPWTELLKPDEYPRTALAMARICLWAGCLKAGAGVPDHHRSESKQEDESRETPVETLAPSQVFWALPDWLLQDARPRRVFPRGLHPFEWRLDWIRTLWQRIHYLARDGMLEPHRDWIEQIDKIYADAWPLTVWALQSYLTEQPSEADLCVDSDWLIAWLASNVLFSKRLGEYYNLPPSVSNDQPDIVSPVTKMRYAMYLSQHILYALHCARHDRRKRVFDKCRQAVHFRRPPFADVPVGLTSSLSEAQLYVLSEYAYREIGVHRELRVFERLIRQLYYELPLHAASSFYRDHLYHVMDVCLLGELLLRSVLPSKSGSTQGHVLVDTLAKHTSSTLSDRLLQNWYVAALCHDLGYVVEQAERLLQPIGEINGEGLDDFAEKISEGLNEGKEAVRQAIARVGQPELSVTLGMSVEEFLETADPTDHGAVAWLHLRQWLKEVQGPPSSLTHALTAIFRHNLPQQEVNVYKEPLTLLLMLCDHIQEWGRPRVGPAPLALGIMEALRFSEQPEFERKTRVHRLLIHGLKPVSLKPQHVLPPICDGCVKSPGCTGRCFRVHTRIEESGLRFELPHAESREADFEPGISWLLFCRDLQCLGSREGMLPFEITITLKHAPARIWSVLPGRPLEMDLLEEFASSCRSAAYLCEWIEFARRGEQGIEYSGDRDTGAEAFTIRLHKLGRPLRRGLSDEHWKDFFRWKWRWLGQKFITLSLGTWFPEL